MERVRFFNNVKHKDVYFSFDKETRKLIKKLGYIPEGCYCSEENILIPEHVEKNRQIVIEEGSIELRRARCRRKM